MLGDGFKRVILEKNDMKVS